MAACNALFRSTGICNEFVFITVLILNEEPALVWPLDSVNIDARVYIYERNKLKSSVLVPLKVQSAFFVAAVLDIIKWLFHHAVKWRSNICVVFHHKCVKADLQSTYGSSLLPELWLSNSACLFPFGYIPNDWGKKSMYFLFWSHSEENKKTPASLNYQSEAQLCKPL